MTRSKRKAKRNKAHLPDSLAYLKTIGISLVLLSHMIPDFSRAESIGIGILLLCAGHALAHKTILEINKGSFSLSRYYRQQFLAYMPVSLITMLSSIGLLTLLDKARLLNIAIEFIADIVGLGNFLILYDYSHRCLITMGNSPFMHMGYAAILLQFSLVWPLLCIAYRKVRDGLGKGDAVILMALFTLWSFTFPTMHILLRPNTTDIMFRYNPAIQAHALFCGALLGVLDTDNAFLFETRDTQIANTTALLYIPLLSGLLSMKQGSNLGYLFIPCLATTAAAAFLLSHCNRKKAILPNNCFTSFVDSITCEAFLIYLPVFFFVDKVHASHDAMYMAISLSLIIMLSIYLQKLTKVTKKLLK